jgi:predicted RNA binding protein YcfA (HicA-like mRNA interferase family)
LESLRAKMAERRLQGWDLQREDGGHFSLSHPSICSHFLSMSSSRGIPEGLKNASLMLVAVP